MMQCLTVFCLQALTFFTEPQKVFLLQHEIFTEYIKTVVSSDFVHTWPTFISIIAILMIMRKYLWNTNWITHFLKYKFALIIVQVVTCFHLLMVSIWILFMLQQLNYCSISEYWKEESKASAVHHPWWQRVWSSYSPEPLQPPIISADLISWIISFILAIGLLGIAVIPLQVPRFVQTSFVTVTNFCGYLKTLIRLQRVTEDIDRSMNPDKVSTIRDDCLSESSESKEIRKIHPISYGTNWVPNPNYASYKEVSMKSLHAISTANETSGRNKLSLRQLRNRRGCHSVIPSNFSDKSSSC